MKNKYIIPEMKVSRFISENIITTSGVTGESLKDKLSEKGVNVNSGAYKEEKASAVFVL